MKILPKMQVEFIKEKAINQVAFPRKNNPYRKQLPVMEVSVRFGKTFK